MKKLITLLRICTTVAILALPGAARNLIAQPANASQDACSTEGKEALYASFLKNRSADQAKAYEDAKKYLACPATEITEGQQKIIDYLKRWATAYEEGSKKSRLRALLYNDMKYPEAYALGKEILAGDPGDLKVLVDLGANGYLVAPLKNPSLSAEALDHASKALQMIESGKTLDDWQPLAGRDIATAYLNYTVGSLSLEKDPATSLKHLLKAAQFETPLKKSPYTYAYIAGAYETGPYAKQSEAYKIFSGKDETPESKLALANINQLIDRMIDGYARAVALAGADPKFSAQKPIWMESLATWYKFRNGDDKGMNEMVAGILSKPLPPEPTPLTSLPTPAATPASSSGSNAVSPTTTTPAASAAPAGTTANRTTAPAASAKPAATKPGDRPRHRR